MNLAEKMVEIHRSLRDADIAHAFGGALALAWCTQRARGTIDLDLNLFVPPQRATEVLSTLPAGTTWSQADVDRIHRDGQVRLWWDTTPVDVFFNTSDFHEQLGERVRWEPFAGGELPFLACSDLAVFKAFFNRTKDWADLEEMASAGTLDVEAVIGVLANHLGGSDARIERLRGLG
jgi:hypothetical protein